MNKFITFEGIDGSGKTTIAQHLHHKLTQQGHDTILTYEPTNTTIGQYVQHCIKTNQDPYVTAFAFIADRILHCKQIQQWLNQHKIVLCDRYAESTYAYQGAQLQKQLKNPIRWLQQLSHNKILTPNQTFLFTIQPELALQRIQHRKELIPFEQITFLTKVHNNYQQICTGPRFHHLDATKTINELVTECKNLILKKQ